MGEEGVVRIPWVRGEGVGRVVRGGSGGARCVGGEVGEGAVVDGVAGELPAWMSLTLALSLSLSLRAALTSAHHSRTASLPLKCSLQSLSILSALAVEAIDTLSFARLLSLRARSVSTVDNEFTKCLRSSRRPSNTSL